MPYTKTGRRADTTGEGSAGAAGEHKAGGQASASVDGGGVEGACDDSTGASCIGEDVGASGSADTGEFVGRTVLTPGRAE